jgi:tetratricopeptide (TPR) repeat protein
MTAGSTRRPAVWASLALTALALLAYANSFHTGFALDNSLILRDSRLHEATRGNVELILKHTLWWPIAEVGMYRPLTSLSFLFNYAMLGDGERPAGYHIFNFLLHAGNIWLAFALALRLVHRFWPAVFLAACWAVHPALTESVTNMVGRGDLLSGMSVLGGFLIYLKSTESRGVGKVFWIAALTVTTTLGIFSKESAIAIIGVIALYELTWWRARKNNWDPALGAIAVLPPIAAYLYQRSTVLSSSLAAHVPFVDNPIAGAGFWVGRLTALKVMANYLALLVWPSRLSSDYSWFQIPLITGTPGDWAAWLAVCAAGAALILLYRRQPVIFFFGLFAFGTFLPVSNLLFPNGTIMGDRLLYLPAYGLLGCIVLAIYWVAERFRISAIAPAVLLLAVCGFAIRTWARNPDWQSNLTLGESAVRAAPRSYKARELLAIALYDADPQHTQLDRAIEEDERAVALLDPLPDSRSTWSSYRQLATFYLAKGDARSSQRAVELLRRVIEIHKAYPPPPPPKPGDVVVQVQFAEAWRTLSGALLRVGDTRGAYDAAIQARDLNPGSVDVYRSIGKVLHAAGRDDEAIPALLEGELLTSDSSLETEAVIIYQARPDANCAITQGTYGPVVNPACPYVHRQLCGAVAAAMQLLVQSRRREGARNMMNLAGKSYGCVTEPLKKILGE